MAQGAYIGVNGVARKITGGYIGVNGKARKLIKAYIGVGGVARPCWNVGGLSYYGAINLLGDAKSGLAAASVGGFALFGGGKTATSISSKTDCYDTNLTFYQVDPLLEAKTEHAATVDGNSTAILFGGGRNTEGYQSSVLTYTLAGMTALPNQNLSMARANLAATTVGDYAIFGGGFNGSSNCNNVDAYDHSLTKIVPQELGMPRYNLAATHVGEYALFGCGQANATLTNRLDVYDSSLTRSSPYALGDVYHSLAAASVGDYAIFAGGTGVVSSSGATLYTSKTMSINKSLTYSSSLSPLADAATNLAATTVADYAIFAGGHSGLSSPKAKATAFDKSLTRTIPTALSVARYNLAAASVGKYAIFAGGQTDASTYVDAVEAYAA